VSATALSAHKPSEAIASLDGIRAVAVSLVFLSHGGLGRFVPGGLGVTIFFVLSGFLITTLMRREHARSGTLELGAFYLRRWLRLMPPLFVVVAGVALAAALGLVQGEFSPLGLLAVLFYFGNYFVIATDFAGLPAGLGVVWSLAVEEHYYVVFPLLALALLGMRPARAAAVLGALCVAILGWRVALFLPGTPEPYIGMATDTRADAILVGCLLAFLRNPALEPIAPERPRRDLALALACLGVLLMTLVIRNEAFRQTLRYTLQGVAIAPLIWLAVVYARRPAGSWLNLAPVAYLGTISYTVYLVHHVMLDAVAWHWPALGAAPTLLAGAVLTLAVAEPVRRYVEQPCARLRRRLHERAAHARDTGVAHATPLPPIAISVCIATHRRPERLAALLEDLRWQRLPPHEVVVVDNDVEGSAAAVVARARARAPYPIRYAVEPRKNIAHARNGTVAMSRGTWLAFVDDDERASPKWLETLARAAMRYGAHGVLGPVEPIVPESAPRWLQRGGLYAFARLRSGEPVPLNRMRFGNVLLSAPLVRAQQPVFDPRYGLTGGEDGDLLARLVHAGARIVWCDDAPVHEPVDASRLSLRWLLLRALRGGQDFARHALAGRYGPPTATRRALLLLRALAQAGLALLLALICLPAGRHHAAHWLARASANLGKLSAFLGWHYREYA